jgi:hypothetical protein
MEPFSTIDKDFDKVLFLEGLCDASKTNFANPKSPTCATISSLRRMLLGFTSQWM